MVSSDGASKAKRDILKFASLLDMEIISLEYMRCLDGGIWECFWRKSIHGEMLENYSTGYNSTDLIESMARDFAFSVTSEMQSVIRKNALAEAGLEKDIQIRFLQSRILHPDPVVSVRIQNLVIARAIRQLFKALFDTGWCQPPLRNLDVLRMIVQRAFPGARLMDPGTYPELDTPVEFKSIAKEELPRWCWENSRIDPWTELVAVAGTADREYIFRMLRESPLNPLRGDVE